MIEEPWRQPHDREGFIDYIPENGIRPIAATIVKSLLPAVLGRWLYDYLALACYGLIRSIAVVHPPLNWYALTAYLAYIVLVALHGGKITIPTRSGWRHFPCWLC